VAFGAVEEQQTTTPRIEAVKGAGGQHEPKGPNDKTKAQKRERESECVCVCVCACKELRNYSKIIKGLCIRS
jgi:hypothetical protein